MTDCPNGEVRDLLPDLLHDRLTPDARQRVEAHVRTCVDCQAELALLHDLRASLRRTPRVDVTAIAAAIPPYRAPGRRAWGGWRAAAAVVLLAVGGTSVALVQRGAGESRDSLRVDTSVVVAGPRDSAMPSATAGAAAPRELAMASTAIGDLDDGELSALLKDIETVDLLPSAEVDNATVSPVAPATAKGSD